jgi:hypothetical protein
VVVILMAVGSEATAVGRALAGSLQWPLIDAHGPRALHAIVAAVLGRREHAIVTSPPLTIDDEAIVRGELHGVRFVDLTDRRGSADEIVGAIRDEFGL